MQKSDVYYKTTSCRKKPWIVWKHWMPKFYWTITRLTKSHENDPSVHRKVLTGWLQMVQITFYFRQKVRYLPLEVSRWIPWLQGKLSIYVQILNYILSYKSLTVVSEMPCFSQWPRLEANLMSMPLCSSKSEGRQSKKNEKFSLARCLSHFWNSCPLLICINISCLLLRFFKIQNEYCYSHRVKAVEQRDALFSNHIPASIMIPEAAVKGNSVPRSLLLEESLLSSSSSNTASFYIRQTFSVTRSQSSNLDHFH